MQNKKEKRKESLQTAHLLNPDLAITAVVPIAAIFYFSLSMLPTPLIQRDSYSLQGALPFCSVMCYA